MSNFHNPYDNGAIQTGDGQIAVLLKRMAFALGLSTAASSAGGAPAAGSLVTTPPISTQSNDGSAAVTGAASVVLAANPGRLNAALVNYGANGLFLSLGGTPIVGQGIYLAPGAGYNINSTNLFQGAISAIGVGGSTTIAYHEGF